MFYFYSVMKIKLLFFSFLSIVLIAIVSCTKAGTGGNATVNCTITNGINTDKLSNITVYIKYGQSTPPSANTSGYDNQIQAKANSNMVSFTGLKQGTYYFYVTAYDSAVTKTTPLTGGGPFSLTHANRNGSSSANFSVSY